MTPEVPPDHLATWPPVMTPKYLAAALEISEASLAQDRYRGRGVPFTKCGARVRYLREDVLKYLQGNRMKRTDDPRPAR